MPPKTAAKDVGNFVALDARIKSFKKWPRTSPNPDELARAGFYFAPSRLAKDSVTCFHCAKSLDSWDDSDNPFQEHVVHARQCAWAQAVCTPEIFANSSQSANPWDENQPDTWPNSAVMIKFREETFSGRWPHQGRRGFFATPNRMARAGFCYTPETAGDDTASCVYCGCTLSNWDPKDNPLIQHKDRSPGCPSFVRISRPRGRAQPSGTTSKKRYFGRPKALKDPYPAEDAMASDNLVESPEPSGIQGWSLETKNVLMAGLAVKANVSLVERATETASVERSALVCGSPGQANNESSVIIAPEIKQTPKPAIRGRKAVARTRQRKRKNMGSNEAADQRAVEPAEQMSHALETIPEERPPQSTGSIIRYSSREMPLQEIKQSLGLSGATEVYYARAGSSTWQSGKAHIVENPKLIRSASHPMLDVVNHQEVPSDPSLQVESRSSDVLPANYGAAFRPESQGRAQAQPSEPRRKRSGKPTSLAKPRRSLACRSKSSVSASDSQDFQPKKLEIPLDHRPSVLNFCAHVPDTQCELQVQLDSERRRLLLAGIRGLSVGVLSTIEGMVELLEKKRKESYVAVTGPLIEQLRKRARVLIEDLPA